MKKKRRNKRRSTERKKTRNKEIKLTLEKYKSTAKKAQ